MMKKVWPPLVLFLLAPVIRELLTGDTPPAEFFTPLGFLVLTILYGGGALLVREMVIRWGRGWYSLLLLGAAFGIITEGLMVKSFFDPAWQDLGVLGYYGRWAGINWIWGFELTVYHAVISIAIPILLTELVFPERRQDSWLPSWLLIMIGVYFAANVVFGYLFLSDYIPGPVELWVTVAVIVVLVLIAWKLPAPLFKPRDVKVPGPWLFALLGFGAMLAFILFFWVLPDFIVLPLVIAILGTLLIVACFWLVLHFSGNGAAWNNLHRLALVGPPLLIFIALTPIQEVDPDRTDNTIGMTAVGGLMLIFLIWLYLKTRQRLKEVESE